MNHALKVKRSPLMWLLAAGIATPLLLALSLPPSMPAWLFWGSLVISTASAFAWGFLGISRQKAPAADQGAEARSVVAGSDPSQPTPL